MARRPGWMLLAIIPLLTAWAAVMPAAQAAAAQTLTVRVGQDLSSGSVDADLMRFLPSQVRVHRGDSLTFTGSFHTATALPLGTDANGWIAAHAARLGQRYFFLARDDEPGTIQFNPNVLYPTRCMPGACTYDGHRLVSSGLLGVIAPQATMLVDAPAGSTFWVICLLHPQMRLQVHVVPGSAAVPSQAQLDAAATAQTTAATARAAALWNSLNSHPHSHVTAGGTRVWDAYAGFDRGSIELFGMFPNTLTIHQGDAVKWHFTQLKFEPHSVVFPASTADVISNGPPPQCEAATGDVPANMDFTCPTGSHGPVEIELDHRILHGGGNGRVTSTTDYENSGARGGFDIPNDQPYLLRFPVTSPAAGFTYACGVHGTMMSGTVIVLPRSA